MSTVVMLPVDIEDAPIVMQALREKLSMLTRTTSLDRTRADQIASQAQAIGKVIRDSEAQIGRLAGKMLADAGKVPV